jgi:hypothetical protein
MCLNEEMGGLILENRNFLLDVNFFYILVQDFDF